MIVNTQDQLKYVRKNFIPIKNKLLNKVSKTENHFEKLLQNAHIYYVREKCNFKLNTRWSYFDYYLPYQKIYIELDGNSHNTDEQKKIDAQKAKIVKRRQAYLLRIKNDDVLAMTSITIDEIKEMLYYYLGSQSKRHTARYYQRRYNEVIQLEHQDAINNMKEALAYDIDINSEVWLYHKDMDMMFKFDNIFEAKLCTKLGVNEIAKQLIEGYDYNPRRKYIFAFSETACNAQMINAYFNNTKI